MAVAVRIMLIALNNIWILCSDHRVSHSAQCVDGLGSGDSFSLEGADHLPYNRSTGYQVILPGLRFNCSGSITSWSALVVSEDFTFSDSNFEVTFQVWRPTGSGRYSLVGYDVINPHATTLKSNTTPYPHPHNSNLVYINLTSSEDNRPLYFQPGDIVGFYIRSRGIVKPFYVTYRNATASDSEESVLDMYYITSRNQQLCQMSECSDRTTVIPSVIPNIYFTYDTLEEVPETNSTEECEVVELEGCISAPSLTSSPTTKTSVTLVPTPAQTTTTTVKTSSGVLSQFIIGIVCGLSAVILMGCAFWLVLVITGKCNSKDKVDSKRQNRLHSVHVERQNTQAELLPVQHEPFYDYPHVQEQGQTLLYAYAAPPTMAVLTSNTAYNATTSTDDGNEMANSNSNVEKNDENTTEIVAYGVSGEEQMKLNVNVAYTASTI